MCCGSWCPWRRADRQGVAATEFALCLPVLLLIVLAMIETCSMIFVKQSLAIAAYEGAHTAVAAGASSANVRATCDSILKDRRITDATITIRPGDITDAPQGDYLRIEVTAPSSKNGLLPVRFFRNKTLAATAVVLKEL